MKVKEGDRERERGREGERETETERERQREREERKFQHPALLPLGFDNVFEFNFVGTFLPFCQNWSAAKADCHWQRSIKGLGGTFPF